MGKLKFYKRGTPKERFDEKYIVDEETGCWIWQAQIRTGGYGAFAMTSKNQIGAHRAAWIIYKGEIPDGLFVCHKCDNPPCCNPEHMFLGTAADNLRDSQDKGRTPRSEHPSIGHYQQGCRCDGCKEARRTYKQANKERAWELQKIKNAEIKAQGWSSVKAYYKHKKAERLKTESENFEL